MDKSMGNTPPDIEQGTPVQEILERDKDAQKNAPEVIKDEIKSREGVSQKRSYSTSARRMAEVEVTRWPAPTAGLIGENNMIEGLDYPDAGPGYKFPMPALASIGRFDHLKRRYDPVVDQVTKLLMRDGKLSVAQKNMSHILNTLRTAPPPQPNPQFPSRQLLLSDNSPRVVAPPSPAPASLFNRSSSANPPPSPFSSARSTLPTSLPRSVLPLHPIEYLTTIIDSLAPLVKIRQQKGLAGGGASTPIPIPLGIRQRRRQAIEWILEAAEKRREVKFADRVAKALLDVAEGRSSAWEKREMAHRLGVAARSNVRPGRGRRRR